MRTPGKPPSELTLLGETWNLSGPGASGATSTVYRLRSADGRFLALKVGASDGERLRLAEEAERLLLVDAVEVPHVFDAGVLPSSAGELRGKPYLALEWLAGRPLDPRRVDDGRREQVALRVARDVGRALEALHAAGVAHGDVKPANVMERDDGRFALVDLGLGEAAGRESPRGGTPRYLAPECFGGRAPGDGRARDVFALGALLAEIALPELASEADLRSALLAARLPEALAFLVSPLVAPAPGARPTADWTSRTARLALREEESPGVGARRRASAVRTAYLSVRRTELLAAARGHALRVDVGGIAGKWLTESASLLARVAELRGASGDGRVVLRDLDAFGRSRFLTALVGFSAAAWPVPVANGDGELAERLLERVQTVEPRSLSLFDLTSGAALEPPRPVAEDPIGLAVSIGSAHPPAAVVDRAEAYVLSHEAPGLGLALATVLRRRGQIGRALPLLRREGGARALLEIAECARRAGDPELALETLESPALDALSAAEPGVGARRAGIRARIALDRGDAASALRLLEAAPRAAATLEVRALSEIALGRLEEARATIAEARAVAESDEERARLASVAGNVAHAAGESRRALTAFLEAADHAARAGAVVEEATALTGVAAAALDAGEVARSLAAATRATLLFEHLGRPLESARAWLARASAFAAVHAVELAREAATGAERRARAAQDTRCRAFAHLVLADVLPGPEGLEHARRARDLLEASLPEDRLRASARELRHGGAVDVGEGDRLAESEGLAVPARLDWWGARAAVAMRQPQLPERADRILSALSALAAGPGPLPGRGEAFAAGAELAARLGDADMARRLGTASADAGRALVEGAPAELRSSALSIPWLSSLRPPRETSLVPEQLADIEALVRSLGTRESLGSLLNQVLDALVLWTGVERGLLLLRAPEGRLVPRAARNIARKDLSGAQLALSRSLAERALSSGEPVVAVDASGELSEVHESVHALKLRSVLALPLVARGEAIGVVYLDDRVRRGAFGPGELSWVRLVAALAAVALADARAELALRRAARKARRAEARLSEALSVRTAALAQAQHELSKDREGRTTRYAYDALVGQSPPIRALFELLDRVVPTEVPVLIGGESGSGKELVARAIHENGPRASGPFVSENCGAIPEGLLESALFGHVRGAFTGAGRPHAGLFEIASGGTLFLDEIGEMSLAMQTKLLRVLEDGEIRPVGSERSRKVDVRIITATHRNLDRMAESGAFRRDLFYRLNVIRVVVPPLRERPGDVELLVKHLVKKHGGGRTVRVSRPALDLLCGFPWPGNVRQLENEIRRALVLADDPIRPEHLSEEVREAPRAAVREKAGLNLRARIDALEAELLTEALEHTAGNQTRAAALLGLSRFGLQKMIRRLGIQASPPLREDAGAVSDER